MNSTSHNQEPDKKKTYNAFLEVQASGVSESTLNLMQKQFNRFPDPDGLTASHFRKRIKQVAPSTVRAEVALAKRFLQWADRDTSELDKKNLKLPRVKDSVTVEDLYTADELASILKACMHTRDRAMLEVLYESAARSSELLSMTFKNTAFNDNGTATITISGKTGTRKVPLYESVASLRTWFNSHPTGEGAIWCNSKRDDKGKYNVISGRRLYATLQLALDRAGIKDKKRIVHMMRHTRATELVRKGLKGQYLSQMMGWTKKSNMESVYVHLSTEDMSNEIHAKIFGLGTKEKEAKPLLESTTCPKCNTKNPQGSRICSKCSMPLSDDAIVAAFQQQEDKEEKIEQMVQERVDESMDRVVQAFAAAIQDIKSTETLKDLAMAFAKRMKEESAATDSE